MAFRWRTTTSSTSSFIPDPNYKVPGVIVELVNALPVNQTDPITQISSGTHYATGLTTPLASFANGKAEQAVYEGFEFLQDKGLTYSGTGVSIQSSARAGKRSLQMNDNVSMKEIKSTNHVTHHAKTHVVQHEIRIINVEPINNLKYRPQLTKEEIDVINNGGELNIPDWNKIKLKKKMILKI